MHLLGGRAGLDLRKVAAGITCDPRHCDRPSCSKGGLVAFVDDAGVIVIPLQWLICLGIFWRCWRCWRGTRERLHENPGGGPGMFETYQ